MIPPQVLAADFEDANAQVDSALELPKGWCISRKVSLEKNKLVIYASRMTPPKKKKHIRGLGPTVFMSFFEISLY